jgi:hypothetical protein
LTGFFDRHTACTHHYSMGSVHDTLRALGLDEELHGLASGEDDDLERVWNECTRGDQLLRLALRVGVDRRLLVRAGCHCVERFLRRLPSNERRPKRALTHARRWAEGECTAAECWAAAFAASGAAKNTYGGSGPMADIASAAASLAFACDDEADIAYYSERAYAPNALWLVARASGDEGPTQHAFAHIVRVMIPYDAVAPMVAPAVRASQMPPPNRDPLRESHVRTIFAEESSPHVWFDPEDLR